MDPAALATCIHRYRSAALIGISQTRDRPGALARKHRALARRLLARQDDYLRFTQDFAVPADDNGTERDIRMAKLRQRYRAACAFSPAPASSALRSYLSTAAKHGRGFFGALVMLAEGQPWIPAPA